MPPLTPSRLPPCRRRPPCRPHNALPLLHPLPQDVAALVGVPAFDFVKIDVEGAEGMVFAPGSDNSWIQSARAVSLEIHDFFAGGWPAGEGARAGC